MRVHFSTALLSTLATCSCGWGKQQKMALVPGLLAPTWETWLEFQAPGFSVAQPWPGCYGHLGCEPVGKISLCLSFSLYLPLALLLK